MRVQFEFTREDLVDATQRLIAHRKKRKSDILQGSLSTAFALGLIVFFVLRKNPTPGLLGGLIAAGIILVLYPNWQRRNLEDRLHKIVGEMMAAPGPYVCEVELRPEGLWLRQMDKQTTYEWKSLESIEETPDSVDIFSHDGGGVVVRNRAFSSAAERSRFVQLIRSNLTQAKAPAGS